MKKIFSVFATVVVFASAAFVAVPRSANADIPVTPNPCVNGKVTVGQFMYNNGVTTTLTQTYSYHNSLAAANAQIWSYNSGIAPGSTVYTYLAVTCNSTGIGTGF